VHAEGKAIVPLAEQCDAEKTWWVRRMPESQPDKSLHNSAQRGERAGARAAELRVRQAALKAGAGSRRRDAELSAQRAHEAHERARQAHHSAAERHERSGDAHEKAAATHERAAADNIGDPEKHRAAAAEHRIARDADYRGAQADFSAAEDERFEREALGTWRPRRIDRLVLEERDGLCASCPIVSSALPRQPFGG